MSVPMSCKIENNEYIVGVYNISNEKLEELKTKYEWINQEEIQSAKKPEEIIKG